MASAASLEAATLAVTHADSLPMPPGVRTLVYEDLGDGSGDGRDMSYLGSGEFCSVFRTRLGSEGSRAQPDPNPRPHPHAYPNPNPNPSPNPSPSPNPNPHQPQP